MADYLVDFRVDGRLLSTSIAAADWADAERQLAALRLTGHIVGERVATIPAGPVRLPFAWACAQLVAWWKNLNRRST